MDTNRRERTGVETESGGVRGGAERSRGGEDHARRVTRFSPSSSSSFARLLYALRLDDGATVVGCAGLWRRESSRDGGTRRRLRPRGGGFWSAGFTRVAGVCSPPRRRLVGSAQPEAARCCLVDRAHGARAPAFAGAPVLDGDAGERLLDVHASAAPGGLAAGAAGGSVAHGERGESTRAVARARSARRRDEGAGPGASRHDARFCHCAAGSAATRSSAYPVAKKCHGGRFFLNTCFQSVPDRPNSSTRFLMKTVGRCRWRCDD